MGIPIGKEIRRPLIPVIRFTFVNPVFYKKIELIITVFLQMKSHWFVMKGYRYIMRSKKQMKGDEKYTSHSFLILVLHA